MIPALRRLTILALSLSVLAGLASARLLAAPFKGAIVVDATSGKVLIEEHSDTRSPPASMTKLMTFLIVQDQIAKGALTLQTPVSVTAQAARTGGSQVYLAEHEVFTVDEMLYALMIQSANDCAVALAIKVAGSEPAFVTMMNARARELGMTRTTFRSPNGLPPRDRKFADSDLTTPRDMARLALYLINHTDILKYTSVKTRVFRPGPRHIDMRNHNHLLWKLPGVVDGLKTGFTDGAGFCLSITAHRDGKRLIAVTMGSPSSIIRDTHMIELINQGFTLIPASSVFQENPISASPVASPTPPASPLSPVIPATTSPAGNGTSSAPPMVKFSMPGDDD